MNENIAVDALAYVCFCDLAGWGLLLSFGSARTRPPGICGVLPSDSLLACA